MRELNSLTGPLLRTRLAFRDFIKQFKPIKIADRLFGNVPIVGGLIKRKIERQEAGETIDIKKEIIENANLIGGVIAVIAISIAIIVYFRRDKKIKPIPLPPTFTR